MQDIWAGKAEEGFINISNQCSAIGKRRRLVLKIWIMKRLLFFVFVIVFWLMACVPAKVQDVPLTTLLPTEISTPPAEESKFVTYQDMKNRFEITYSKDVFTPDLENSNDNLLLLVLNIEKLFPGKNLENVVVRIAAGPICRYKEMYYKNPEKETINDINFSVYSTRDAGTFSNVFETLTYQTYHKGLCYEIHLSIREYTLQAHPELSEYDPEVLLIEFKNLLNTFKFIE